jgi:hypothetical protein
MTVQYWIAKNVEDPFRNESRNVGVITRQDKDIAARFMGERESGAIDRRLLGQRFRYPDIYLQWVNYWRGEIKHGRIDSVVKAASENYYVVEGGGVSDTGADSVDVVCSFLYTLLVSDESVMTAFELAIEADETKGLGSEITNAFTELNILSDTAQFSVRHPIKRDETIRGKHIAHTPSFSQRNGSLHVYEAIDFTAKKPKLIRERAGWMAYMYTDIKQQEQDAKTYSIYRPSQEGVGEIVEYAQKMLGGESGLINWANDNERNRFLTERQRLAESLVA